MEICIYNKCIRIMFTKTGRIGISYSFIIHDFCFRFINARRRILQPMLEASNPDQVKQKKSKPQNRPLQRFWPESLANYQPQFSPALMSMAPISSGGINYLLPCIINQSTHMCIFVFLCQVLC